MQQANGAFPTSLSRRLHEIPCMPYASSPQEKPAGSAVGSPPCSGSRTLHPCRSEPVPFSESGHLPSERTVSTPSCIFVHRQGRTPSGGQNCTPNDNQSPGYARTDVPGDLAHGHRARTRASGIIVDSARGLRGLMANVFASKSQTRIRPTRPSASIQLFSSPTE